MEKKPHDLRQILQETIDFLDKATISYVSGDERDLNNHVWKSAFNLEYLTFILSLSIKNRDKTWKKEEKAVKIINFNSTLLRVQDLLKEALKNDSIKEVYEKAWTARSHIANIQRKLAKIKSK